MGEEGCRGERLKQGRLEAVREKVERPFVETVQMIQKAFGDNAMSAAQIKMWHKFLKDGQESVEHLRDVINKD